MNTNWQTKKLGELFDITSSKRVFKSEWKDEGIPFYRAREIVKLAKDGFVNNELFISEEMYNKYSKKYGAPVENDIMVTGVGTLGICYVVKKDHKFYFKDGNIIWLKNKSLADSKFIEYLFKSEHFIKQINNNSGTTVGTFTIIKAKNMIVNLPSIGEQKRIVKKLDTIFENINKAKENTEKNLQNSKEFFETYLQSIFEDKNEGYKLKTIKEIAKVKGGKRVPKGNKLSFENTGFPYIRVTDFNDDGGINVDSVKFVSENIYKLIQNYTISSNDMYLSIAGTIGKSGIIPKELDGANLTENAVRLIFNNHIYNKYIYFFTKTKSFQIQAGLNTRTTAMPKLAISRLENILIPIPDTKQKQEELVKKFEYISEQIKKLEENYKQKLLLLDELKKSVLEQAFSGNL